MFKKKLSALEIRKRLLVAESNLNRTLLTSDYHALSDEIREVARPVREVAGLISSVGSWIDMFKGMAKGETTWTGRLIKLGMALWNDFVDGKKDAEKSEEFVG